MSCMDRTIICVQMHVDKIFRLNTVKLHYYSLGRSPRYSITNLMITAELSIVGNK